MNALTAWRTRRRNRRDAAVLGALLLGDEWFLDIQRRIGGGSGSIYPSLSRLEAAGRVRVVQREATSDGYIRFSYHVVLATGGIVPAPTRPILTDGCVFPAVKP